MVHPRCSRPSSRYAAALAGAVLLAIGLAAVPNPACAGFLDFLFSGFHRDNVSPSVNSYAEPGTPGRSTEGEHLSGRGVVFCVRLCDGQHFPMEHITNATPVETCRAMCPASKTKVFFGGEIDGSVARDGQRYADADNAFLYRKQLVANCTCNGKDAFGLAHFDMTQDSTLRPGDIVATKNGFVAYTDARGQGGTFTPVATAEVKAQLMPGGSRVRVTRRAEPPAAAAADEPGTIVPAQSVTPAQGLRPTSPSAQSFR